MPDGRRSSGAQTPAEMTGWSLLDGCWVAAPDESVVTHHGAGAKDGRNDSCRNIPITLIDLPKRRREGAHLC